MARINKISITLCALLFTTLPFTPMAHASRQAKATPAVSHVTKTADKKKSTTKKISKTRQKKRKKNLKNQPFFFRFYAKTYHRRHEISSYDASS
ncbi:hypothetical protein SEEP9945_22450 [Salmonella enterica subsp. enterica serovar Pullorum str. 19945]|nr:hypothetical protein SEEP9945_22450 [Salmonella enterica subsp. enterica serovar Pullorum str. 19945]